MKNLKAYKILTGVLDLSVLNHFFINSFVIFFTYVKVSKTT